MAAPIITTSLDRPDPAVYAINEIGTLTIQSSDPDAVTNTITVTGTDAEGHAAVASMTYSISDPVSLVVKDSSGKTWVKQSDNGSIAIYKATM